MKFIALLAAAGAAFIPFVSAHGYVKSITIDGTQYRGPVPNNDPDLQSPIRAINDVSPVKGAGTRAVNCGQNAKPAALVVDAKPGSSVTFDWAGGDSGHWPHNTGPIITYMAACDGTCDKYDPIDAEFFKIHQAGRKNNGTGDWAQADLMAGGVFTLSLPNNLPAGDYMIRHEIIGLHLATNPGGAEFYPSCTQIRLSAPTDASTAALPTDTVKFPGGYSDSDPGILDANVFDSSSPYNFPGPNPIDDAAVAAPVAAAPAPAPSAPAASAPSASAQPCPGMVRRSRFFRNLD